MQRGIRAIDEEFKDNYAEHVQKDPARVPPMALEVDAEILNGNRRGRSRPRPQGEDKARALRLMVAELLKLGVIRASTEITGAQVLLVAKKGSEKLRFCIDYRVVNQATVGREGWPIPDIKAMIEHLGRKRSKFFGVMDLTSGFH